MPVLSEPVPPSSLGPLTSSSSSAYSSKTQTRYIFGGLALVFIFVFLLQKRLERRRRSEKDAKQQQQYSPHDLKTPTHNLTDLSSNHAAAARMSLPSALREKQSASRPLQQRSDYEYDFEENKSTSIMQPISSAASASSSPRETPFLSREEQGDLTIPPHSDATATPPHYYSRSYPGVGADTASSIFPASSNFHHQGYYSQGQGQGQGQGQEDPSITSQATPPSKTRILRPPQTTPTPPLLVSAAASSSSSTTKIMELSANTNSTLTLTSKSRRSSSGTSTSSSLIHPDLPDPSITSLNTILPGPFSLSSTSTPTTSTSSAPGPRLSIYTNTTTNTITSPNPEYIPHSTPGNPSFEPLYPLTFVPSPTEYTSFEALYSQNPPYYEETSSSSSSEAETGPGAEQIPRRRSYTKSLSNGSEVSGEIIVSSSGVEGQGWRRHTRVFGGGVCRACEESRVGGGAGGRVGS